MPPFATLPDPSGRAGTWKLFVMYDRDAKAYYGQVLAPLGHIALVTEYVPASREGIVGYVALHTSQLLREYFERRK